MKFRHILGVVAGLILVLLLTEFAHGAPAPSCEARLGGAIQATAMIPGDVHRIGEREYVIRKDDRSFADVCRHLAEEQSAEAGRNQAAIAAATEPLRQQLEEHGTLDYWLHRHPIYGWLIAVGLGGIFTGIPLGRLGRRK